MEETPTPPPGAPAIRAGGSTPLLLVREFDWLNASDDAPPIMASFGGHCAPAHYTVDPPTLLIRNFGDDPAADVTPEAALVRDFRDSPRPEKTVTTSADRIAFEAGANHTLASPYELRNTSIILAWASYQGDGTFVVERTNNGTERRVLAPGERVAFSVGYDFELDGHDYRGEHVLEFANLGRAALSHQAVGMCV